MTLEKIIYKHLPSSTPKITPQTILFSSGLLDSLSLIDIIQEIEQVFDIKTHWSELNLENFDSIEKIQQYISEKKHETKS